eukprot:gene22129-biopygen4199
MRMEIPARPQKSLPLILRFWVPGRRLPSPEYHLFWTVGPATAGRGGICGGVRRRRAAPHNPPRSVRCSRETATGVRGRCCVWLWIFPPLPRCHCGTHSAHCSGNRVRSEDWGGGMCDQGQKATW